MAYDSTDRFHHEAGKGSAPRRGFDYEKFSSNWDLTFGKKKEKDEKSTDLPSNSDSRTGVR